MKKKTERENFLDKSTLLAGNVTEVLVKGAEEASTPAKSPKQDKVNSTPARWMSNLEPCPSSGLRTPPGWRHRISYTGELPSSDEDVWSPRFVSMVLSDYCFTKRNIFRSHPHQPLTTTTTASGRTALDSQAMTSSDGAGTATEASKSDQESSTPPSSPSILPKDFNKHADNSTISSDDEGSEVYSHQKADKKNLSYMHCNIRGYMSKKLSFKNIIQSSDFDVVFVTETHRYNGKGPEVPGYVFTNRCRSKVNSKGGVSIGLKKELEPFAVKVFEGKDSNECILIKLTCFNPNIIVGVYYGNQEATASFDTIRANMAEMFAVLHDYNQRGCDIILGGDFNVHIGTAIPGNDPAVSKGGQLLLNLVNELGFDIINHKAEGSPFTHYDVSSGNKRVLDFIISNKTDEHVIVAVDNERLVTPYRLKMVKGELEQIFTDHLSVYGEMEVKRSKKMSSSVKVWRLSRPGGKAEYLRITDEMSEELRTIILESETVDIMLDKINKLIQKAKMEAFGIRTMTHKQYERECDERLAYKRLKDIEDAKYDMDAKGMKINEQVFLTRKNITREREEILATMEHYKTGEKLDDIDEIFDSVLDYNAETLKKNECKDERSRILREGKAEAVNFFENLESDWSEEQLTVIDYKKVIAKIQAVNKTCYRDFLWAGPKWQAEMFLMFQRVYMSEKIPNEFMKTKLKQLYKRKGNKNKLSSYRFIHLKDWAGKMMEKLVMAKCQDVVAGAMPNMQIGGMKKRSCTEHLVSILTLAKIKCKQGKGMLIQTVDCMKCFDKQLLTDTMFSAAKAGLHGKRLRMIRKLHEDTEISLVGDQREKTAVIKNSTGQGTNWAPAACSLSMGQAMKEEVDRFDETKMKLGDLKIEPFSYVDDTIRCADCHEGAVEGGEIFTRALNELGLEAHPDKSAQILMGSNKWREEMREKLKNDPVVIQGFELKESQEETYLGIQLSSKGPRDSVTQSIKRRIRAAVAKEVQLSKILEDDIMDRVGWLEAVKTLFNSIIMSTLTYGSIAYVFMTKVQLAELEACMKDILYRMLKISKYAHFAAVLFECNMIRMRHIINQLKISFINELIHSSGKGVCLDILRKEEELYPGTGLLAEVSQLCDMYNIPDVTRDCVEKEHIKAKVWSFGREEVWKEAICNKRIPFNDNHMKVGKPYMRLPKYDARLFFAYRIGELQFKAYRKGEFIRKFGNTKCFADGCGEQDTLQHAMRCDGYDQMFGKDEMELFELDAQKEFIAYLKKMDTERARKYYLPLLYRREPTATK